MLCGAKDSAAPQRKLKVAIDGIGRIGRVVLRACLNLSFVEVTAINDPYFTPSEIEHLCKYDSLRGRLPVSIGLTGQDLVVGGQSIALHHSLTPDLAFPPRETDVLVWAAGVTPGFSEVLSLLAQQSFITVFTTHVVSPIVKLHIYGLDDDPIANGARLIALSTCDANAVLPVYRMLVETYQVEDTAITTLHPYLNDQNLLDGKSPIATAVELGRGAVTSIIPKRTSLEDILRNAPKVSDLRVSVMSFRVPTVAVANATLCCVVGKPVSTSALKEELSAWCRGPWAGIGSYSTDPCVSVDYLGMPYSFIIDDRWVESTGRLTRVVVWYDNEWQCASLVQRLLANAHAVLPL